MLHLVSQWPQAGRPSLGGQEAARAGLVFHGLTGVRLGTVLTKDTNMGTMSLILLPSPLQTAGDQHTKVHEVTFPGTPVAAAVAPDSSDRRGRSESFSGCFWAGVSVETL